jgi:hypothetical protein
LKTQQAIFSFSAGVLSPRISARADSEKFSQALQVGKNWIITPQGGAIFRQGFEHLETVAQGRVFQFHQGGNESDVLIEVLSDGDIHFHGDSTININDLVDVHTYTIDELEELYFVNQERYGIILHKAHPPLYLELNPVTQQFSAYFLESSLIPEYAYQDDNSPGAASNVVNVYSVTFVDGTTGKDDNWIAGSWFRMLYSNRWAWTGDNIMDLFYGATTAETEAEILRALRSIPAINTVNTTITVAFNSGTTYDVTITGKNSGQTLEVIAYGNPVNEVGRFTEVSVADISRGLPEPAWSYPTYVFYTTDSNYYQCIAPHKSTAGINPTDVTYWTLIGVTKPDTFDYSYPDGNDWQEDIVYSPNDRGFPTVTTFHEQRLIFAAAPFSTTALWGSRIGFYKDFVGGPDSDDPFSFTLDTADTPTIKWMTSQIRLMVGTSAGDWRIGSEITLGPGDISAIKQNNSRSYKTPPVVSNVDVFYIEQGQTKIRSTSYAEQLNSFTSLDVSIMAEHLFHGGVKRIVIMQTPEVLIVVLREDGTLAAMTYAQNMGAWTEIETQGHIRDIATYYSTITQQDELWVQISYAYVEGGPNIWQLERMPYPSRTMTPYLDEGDETLTEQGVICIDSWTRGQMNNNVITGIEHLEGQVVGAIVNDAWAGLYTVTGGAVTLDDLQISGSEPYEGEYAVGLMYEGDIHTFEVATGNQYQRGTGLGTVRRWAKLYVRLLDSALPIINGVLPPDRTPEMNMNIAEILRMGLQDVVIRGGEWGDGSITIKQDRPYPTQVVGLYGEFQTGND